MLTIGFTNKYYTLWHVSEPYKVRSGDGNHDYVMRTQFTYRQNLSFDFEAAKRKAGEFGSFNVDLGLKGQKTWYQDSEKMNDAPAGAFAFGKYSGQKFAEPDDLNYLRWYFNQTDDEIAKGILEENGYGICGNSEMLTPDDLAEYIESASHVNGHHHRHGERIKLQIKEIDVFGFEGRYGWTNVITYITADKLKFKYVGSACPNVSGCDFTEVNTTIWRLQEAGSIPALRSMPESLAETQ